MVTEMNNPHKTENVGYDLLLEGIYKRYGYDFRGYAQNALKRRLREFLVSESIDNYMDLLKIILYNSDAFSNLLLKLTVNVTEMFRDPDFFVDFRHFVVPLLKTYPFIKIWIAGCATGEEAYSLAILLAEEELLHRTTIYATDINIGSLETAKLGIYPLDKIKLFSKNYIRAGGKSSLSTYYHAKYDSAILSEDLKKKINFSEHNLCSDSNFAQVNVVFCRNVLIYFDRAFQEKALKLLDDSLDHLGYLCLGVKESLVTTSFERDYKKISEKNKIYQKLT